LYFETGGSTLTGESKAQLTDLLAEAQAATAPDVAVIGHTDTTGAAETNAKIAFERALAVRDLLVGAGLDPALIEVVSHGETDVLVPTPDGTAEARNRRVEVTIR
jgi:outer membrane protein OmpA-like peptidoglycan-associated protein